MLNDILWEELITVDLNDNYYNAHNINVKDYWLNLDEMQWHTIVGFNNDDVRYNAVEIVYSYDHDFISVDF